MPLSPGTKLGNYEVVGNWAHFLDVLTSPRWGREFHGDERSEEGEGELSGLPRQPRIVAAGGSSAK